jgi:hypothetical protein
MTTWMESPSVGANREGSERVPCDVLLVAMASPLSLFILINFLIQQDRYTGTAISARKAQLEKLGSVDTDLPISIQPFTLSPV